MENIALIGIDLGKPLSIFSSAAVTGKKVIITTVFWARSNSARHGSLWLLTVMAALEELAFSKADISNSARD
jgi:beta-lactamase regulating signal transducer with metallopeptidase domain